MRRTARSIEINEAEVAIYHVTTRCVRRAFLMGNDRVIEKCFDWRRLWLLGRLIWLAMRFKIDIIGFSIMANHFHLILRNRPDLVKDMSDEEVVRAWWNISPRSRKRDGSPCSLTPEQLEKQLANAEHIKRCRSRLSSISTLMWYLKQPLAVKANAQDDRSGHFFEGRFRVTKMHSLTQLSHAIVYTDLNPIRAGIANSIETSDYTSGQLRFLGAKRRRELRRVSNAYAAAEREKLVRNERLHECADDWLSPIEMRETDPMMEYRNTDDADETATVTNTPTARSHGSKKIGNGYRASDRGVLTINAEEYLVLVDIIGRRKGTQEARQIPSDLPPILAELGVESAGEWLAMYDDHVAARESTFRTKVNSDKEAALTAIEFQDSTKSNQDAMM